MVCTTVTGLSCLVRGHLTSMRTGSDPSHQEGAGTAGMAWPTPRGDIMTSTSHTRIAASGGVVLITLAVFVLLVSIAQAAAPTPLRGGAGATYPASNIAPLRGGAAATYAASNLAPLRGGAAATYAAADLTPLRGGAGATYAAAGPLARAVGFGRGGVFVRTTPVAASTPAVIGGFAGTALVVALVAFLGLGGRASRRGELAPVTSLVQPPSASPATQYEDRERKAA